MSGKRTGDTTQEPLTIQPVNRPILSSPYVEPQKHWVYDTDTGLAHIAEGRRPASFLFRYQTPTAKAQYQQSLFLEEEMEELPLVNALRQDIRGWRNRDYEGATEITKQLLRHWGRADRPRRLFFCQLEAVESVIFLNEIRLSGKFFRGKPNFTDEHLSTLWDTPADPSFPLLRRMGVKMATGSGKTVVMSMLIAWAFCNRGQVASDDRFPSAVLAVCPNLTIKERLQVLRPDNPANYYERFDLVPTKLRPLLQSGKVLVENWHLFLPESEHAEGGQSYAVVNKGPEGPEAYARKRLGDLFERAPVMLLNDEAHHAWRPAALLNGVASDVDQEEWQEATVWVNGLDMINLGANNGEGIKFCVDLSATPFYIGGSGYTEGQPYPWIVSDFGLVDAIESGIVKIPRLPVSDTTGRPEAKFFHLWRNIVDNLQPGERLPGKGRKPKPDVIYREAHDALTTLASQWKERYGYIEAASNVQEKTPPVMIVVCDNTDLAEVFYRHISGEYEEKYTDEEGKEQKRVLYRGSEILPEFSNSEHFKPTVRIDSKLLAQAESADLSREDAAEQLRQIVATVGKPGEPGEHVRCVVSVAMLTEGWDANNVTHILGLRAFGSQLLCEQVVGRGLRRMDYTPDPQTGMLTEEYVDIYGVPFSLIPFKGRKPKETTIEDRPKNHVRSLDERAHYRIEFPVVEGYAFALKRNAIKADVAQIEPLRIQPEANPTSVFVKPRVGYESGSISLAGPGEFAEQDRQAFYDSTHIQTLKFQIAGEIVFQMVGEDGAIRNGEANKRYVSRHQLFPQVFRIVDAYVENRIDFRAVDRRELGLKRYFDLVVERLMQAIRPDDGQGESPLLPILNRYQPKGSTDGVNFTTTRPIFSTHFSHINAVAADTATWEQSAAFRLEQAAMRGIIECYARNDNLDFTIPYEFLGVSHHYEPDFLVRYPGQKTLILEIKGWQKEEAATKHEAAKRWVSAVNNWGKMGQWAFHVNKDPQLLLGELGGLT
ncbi:MAG: DEAD/DEAH box helicase family protein [Caldilineaceae bacterium]|nr:DEAD/DEAH box helicase family protein [Caldilineaceae bacterium]